MKGKIAIEEAFDLPRNVEQQKWWASFFAANSEKHIKEMMDIQKLRIEKMDKHARHTHQAV